MLSEREKTRYNRHLILEGIGENGQILLKQAKVLVVGAGGLGCAVLQNLTAAGVGTIGIVDDDVIDESNLQRQVLYSTNEIDLKKTLVAAKKMRQLNPYINIVTYTDRLTYDMALRLFSKYTIIMDCTDNLESRYAINDAAVATDRPFVSGSIFRYEGQLSVFNYKKGPTYRCLYPDEKSLGFGCSETGVLGVLTSIIGSYQAMEAIKMILKTGDILSGKLRVINLLKNEDYLIGFDRIEEEISKKETLEGYEESICQRTHTSG